MHGLINLFLGVITLAIILLAVGLAVPHVLVITSTTIMALIVAMTIIRSAIISIASMMVAVVATAMLAIALFRTTCGTRKMSHFLFLWLLLILGNLINNTSRLVGCLTLLKEGNHSTWVGRHRLIQVSELVLVHLRLCKEDLFSFLLRRGYVHCLTEVVTLKVAEKLHLMPHELVHWHESRIICRTKPANQLVANVGEPGNDLKVVPDALVEVCLCPICIVRASFCNDAGPLRQAYLLKALTQEAKQQWTIVLLQIR